MSGRSLSKGTLGLKFMNKVQPKPLISDDSAPAPAASSSKSAAGSSEGSSAKGKGYEKVQEVKMEVDEKPRKRVVVKEEANDWSRPVVSAQSSRQIIHESSLLSFPLLSSFNSRPSASSAKASSSSRPPASHSSHSYSSMPMTASVISGRRSYGGANAEIESLNNPTMAPPAATASSKDETASQKKKRKKAESESLPLNVRASPAVPKRELTQKQKEWKTDADEVKLGGSGRPGAGPVSKKVKLEQGVFARPAGFEGALKGLSAKGAYKGKGKKVEEEPVWGKRGSAREWDEGKGAHSDSDSDSDHGVFDVVDDDDLPSQSESEDSDSDEDVEEMLGAGRSSKSAAGGGKKAAKAAFEREVEEMFKREEEGSGKKKTTGSAKSKKGGSKMR